MSKSKNVVPMIPNRDLQEEKVQAKYQFAADELVELGRLAGRNQAEAESLDMQLSSIKKDYQSRIEAAEMRRNAAFDRINDGFEMREYPAVIAFNTPKKGMKTIYHLAAELPEKIGAIIREESMTPSDCQAELFRQRQVEEKKESGKGDELPNPVVE